MEAKRESKNLGDLLRIQPEDLRRHNDDIVSAGSGARRVTLLAILSDTPAASRRQTHYSPTTVHRRTLVEILRDEEEQTSAVLGGSYGRTIRWGLLKNMRIRLNRSSNNHVEAAAVSISSDATRGEVGPSRTSLMALLEENDRQMGLDGYEHKLEEEEEEEEEEELNSSSSSTTRHCCVCMVRHRGAAFIPCGHTFCRLCSRELWVQRGSCPLCNNKILEILDIF